MKKIVNKAMNQTIIVDYRECADVLKQELVNADIAILEKKLNIGDYVISPDTLVERKTTHDFCMSIIDGRLFSQAYRLARFAENPIIILEGESFTKNVPVNIGISQIKGALISLAQTFRIPVLRTMNQKDSAWHLKQLASQRKRIGMNKGPHYGYTPKKLQTKKEYVLRMLPGIGPKKAKQLLDEFGSITNIVNASPEDLKKVSGLGQKTIDEIFHVIREEYTEYSIY